MTAEHSRDAARVVVVGSVHMDLVASAPRLPRPGESLLGTDYFMHPGGKGGNQAVAASQQGAATAIVARVGNDGFGGELRHALARKGVDVSLLQMDEDEATGLSPVLMGAGGEYASIVVPGASQALTAEALVPAHKALCSCVVLMLQLEVGLSTNAAAARLASAAGATVVLNAAPAPSLAEARDWGIWRDVDILIVNRDEAEALSGIPIGGTSDVIQAAVAIRRQLGTERIIVTLGSEGATLVDEMGELHVPGFVVPVVDTIGAGDAFAGAVGAALARGADLRDAVELGNAAGAMAVRCKGAYDAPPRLDETREFFASRHPGAR